MYPYPATVDPASPLKSTISELYVEPDTLVARVQWSSGSSAACGEIRLKTTPAALRVAGSYLIYSGVSYTFMPAVPVDPAGWADHAVR